MLLRISAAAAAACVFAGSANAEVTAIASGGVAASITCDQAYEFQRTQASRTPKPTPDEILANFAVASKCAAEAYNKAQEEQGSDERVIAVANVSGEGQTRSIAFDMIKISAKDEAQARVVCQGASVVMGIVVGDKDPLLTPVITQAGNYTCGSYIDALISSNPLLIVAPTMIPGVSITKDVLVAVGIPRETVDKIEADFNRELTNAGRTVVEGTVQVVADATPDVTVSGTNITVSGVPSVPKCVKVFGKKVCR